MLYSEILANWVFLFILGCLPLIFLEYSTGWPDQFSRKENSTFTKDYPAKSVYSEILCRAEMGSSKRFEKRRMSPFQTHRSGILVARDFSCAVSGLAHVFLVTRPFFSRGFPLGRRPSLYSAVRFANFDGNLVFFCSVNHFSEGRVYANQSVTCSSS